MDFAINKCCTSRCKYSCNPFQALITIDSVYEAITRCENKIENEVYYGERMVDIRMEYLYRVSTPKMTYKAKYDTYNDDRNYSNESCRTVIVLPIRDTLIDERKGVVVVVTTPKMNLE